jgi:hypothetical protein
MESRCLDADFPENLFPALQSNHLRERGGWRSALCKTACFASPLGRPRWKVQHAFCQRNIANSGALSTKHELYKLTTKLFMKL